MLFRLLLILSFCLGSIVNVSAQEIEPPREGEVREAPAKTQPRRPVGPGSVTTVTAREEQEKQESGKSDSSKNKKAKKDKTEKKKKKGPAIVATHKKTRVKRYFYVGEKVSYQTKTMKKREKGVIMEISRNKIKIDSAEVKATDLVLVGKKFGKTLGWRTAGLGTFAIGTGITAAGVALTAYSSAQFSVDNSNVVWSVLGTVIGAGTSFVGIHLMVKGGKNVFQSSKKKLKNGWTFKTQ